MLIGKQTIVLSKMVASWASTTLGTVPKYVLSRFSSPSIVPARNPCCPIGSIRYCRPSGRGCSDRFPRRNTDADDPARLFGAFVVVF